MAHNCNYMLRRLRWFVMPVEIVVDDTNGAKNIDKSRQETNRSNLAYGKRCWMEIIAVRESDFPDYGKVKFSTTGLTPAEKTFFKYVETQISTTIPSRIEKNFIHYGLKDPSSISWKQIKKMAQLYLDADPWLQINYCMDSTRQGVDEQVQRRMLNQYVGAGEVFEKAQTGIYVHEGKIWMDKRALLKHKNQTKLDIKDIDTYGEIGKKRIFLFQKYTKVAGGHQDNVYAESFHVVSDFNEYVGANTDENYLVAQLDGEYMEQDVIPRLQDIITHKKRVFAGNSESVIEWLKKL
jgi:hypothetical protein